MEKEIFNRAKKLPKAIRIDLITKNNSIIKGFVSDNYNDDYINIIDFNNRCYSYHIDKLKNIIIVELGKIISFNEALKLPIGVKIRGISKFNIIREGITGGDFYNNNENVGIIRNSGFSDYFSKRLFSTLVVLKYNNYCNHKKIKVPLGIGPGSEIIHVCKICGEEI